MTSRGSRTRCRPLKPSPRHSGNASSTTCLAAVSSGFEYLKPTRTLPIAHADGPLTDRYHQAALAIFDHEERERFLDSAGQPRDRTQVQWELLYRHEPWLFARLIAGERLHPGILEWLPAHTDRALEIGAGTG